MLLFLAERKYCSQEGCDNQVQQGGICYKHGARVAKLKDGKKRGARKCKYCSQNGCVNQVKQGGVCVQHGAIVKRCSHIGCNKQPKQGGVCIQHGAIVKRKRG